MIINYNFNFIKLLFLRLGAEDLEQFPQFRGCNALLNYLTIQITFYSFAYQFQFLFFLPFFFLFKRHRWQSENWGWRCASPEKKKTPRFFFFFFLWDCFLEIKHLRNTDRENFLTKKISGGLVYRNGKKNPYPGPDHQMRIYC